MRRLKLVFFTSFQNFFLGNSSFLKKTMSCSDQKYFICLSIFPFPKEIDLCFYHTFFKNLKRRIFQINRIRRFKFLKMKVYL